VDAELENVEVIDVDDRGEFDRLEDVVRQGLHTFIEVGGALLEINRRKLYRTLGFASFAEYAEQRWGISRSYAYRQIEAARVVNFLEQAPHLPPPANESQARELSRLNSEPEVLREVWADALRDANGNVTAGDLRRLIDLHKRRTARSSRSSRRVASAVAKTMTCPHCGAEIRVP
jgi:hypothetical protein